jgi:cytochrome c-type biogenesis protein
LICLGLPFLLAGAFISKAGGLIKTIVPYLKTLNMIFGVLLIFLGILIITGNLSAIANFAGVWVN